MSLRPVRGSANRSRQSRGREFSCAEASVSEMRSRTTTELQYASSVERSAGRKGRPIGPRPSRFTWMSRTLPDTAGSDRFRGTSLCRAVTSYQL
jgi:hypothetical protein